MGELRFGHPKQEGTLRSSYTPRTSASDKLSLKGASSMALIEADHIADNSHKELRRLEGEKGTSRTLSHHLEGGTRAPNGHSDRLVV